MGHLYIRVQDRGHLQAKTGEIFNWGEEGSGIYEYFPELREWTSVINTADQYGYILSGLIAYYVFLRYKRLLQTMHLLHYM